MRRRQQFERRLQFEAFESRRMLSVVSVEPLPQSGYVVEWGCISTQDISVVAVAASRNEEGGLEVRFRIRPGGPEPVKFVLDVNGDEARQKEGASGPMINLLAVTSMLSSESRMMTLSGDTDFVVVGEPAARYLMMSISVRDRYWMNNGLSVGQQKDGGFFSIDIASAIEDIAAGVQSPGVRGLVVPDVSGDGFTSPIDALAVVNYLQEGRVAPQGAGISFLEPEDVNGDGIVSPLDALLVVNVLNDASSRDAAFAAYGE